MANMTMIQAITDALAVSLEKDPKTLIFGEDVGKNGGVFRATTGLQEKFGEDRVFNTPLAESGIGGLAIGLAFEKFRPIMEIQFLGFLYEVMDSIAGQMARYRFRMSSTRNMAITVRTPFGGGVHAPEMHCDSLEGLLVQTPGIKVVVPSNPIDAKGLLISAIEDNDPVIFLEHMKLYRSIRDEVPEGYYKTEIGKAKVVSEGSDVTIITYAAMVHEAIKASKELQNEGISTEIIDLRTLYPLDIQTIGESIKKTGRVVIVQEAQKQAGVASMVASEIAEKFMFDLSSPIGIVAAPDTVYPFAMAEGDWLPKSVDIIDKVKEIVEQG